MELSPPSTKLLDGDRIAVVGGGPAGSFFAIHLLREARRVGRSIEVVLIEKRGPLDQNLISHQCRGCNFCAGILSPRLNEILGEDGLAVPQELIQERIESVWIHGQWKNFRLRVPQYQQMYSVYRGSLPGRRRGNSAGFDGFLLDEAVKEGAQVLYGNAQAIAYGNSGRPIVTIRLQSGKDLSLEAGFVSIATGINGRYGMESRPDAILDSLEQLNPSFIPGRSRQALIFELDVGEPYLQHHMNREVHFIEYGSKHFPVEHSALIPKGRFLTVAVIGKCIDRAALPQDSQRMIEEFLTLPHVDRMLPGVLSAPLACVCAPRMTVTTAGSPFGDRFAIIGDAAGSRLNKDGLYSAYTTASKLAKVVLHQGIDRQALERGYGKTIQWLVDDNRCGRIVFAVSRTAFSTPMVSRVVYQAFASEYKSRDEQRRPLSGMLWRIASGTADYREVLREMHGWGVLASIVSGAATTLRNVAVELVLGIKWGKYGRYPAVVPVERRRSLKERVAASLGMELGDSPDFERMYEIKIRGSETEIMEQLAKYGQPDATFVNLRFVQMRQIKGTPNEVGSVIRYAIPYVRLAAELRLTAKVQSETLLYEADDRLVENGRLIFNVAPTRDDNRRLLIYAAFDYKKGKGPASRLIWRGARLLFPEFVHDVVWNHGLCTIKEEVEWKRDHAG